MDRPIVLSQLPLAEIASEVAREVCSRLDERPEAAPPAPEELLTRVEAAQLLGISLPTLGLYTKRGLVTGYRIATRVRYKRSEMLASLQKIRTAGRKH